MNNLKLYFRKNLHKKISSNSQFYPKKPLLHVQIPFI